MILVYVSQRYKYCNLVIYMKYGLLVKKIHLIDKRYLTAEEIKSMCKEIGVEYLPGIKYLISNGHLIRILKGFFYVKSLEERSIGVSKANFFEALAKALEYKRAKWYFGFDTAIRLSNLTHEYFPIDYVVSDRIFRSKTVKILGHKVKFIKLKKELFGFGVRSNNEINYSDPEKSILDIIHLRKHRGIEEAVIKNEIADILKHANKKKLNSYAGHYSISVRDFVRRMS